MATNLFSERTDQIQLTKS